MLTLENPVFLINRSNRAMNPFTSGVEVRLNTPENSFAHGQLGTVREGRDWGAVLDTQFGTRQFRASFEEMELVVTAEQQTAVMFVKSKEAGYTGGFCDFCGSCRMVRNGTCVLCQDCGSTSGCS